MAKILIFISLVIILAASIAFGLKLKNGKNKQLATVARADVVTEVSATGKVRPNQSVDIGFDRSGRIGEIFAVVGDTVKSGQVIASLESGETEADLEKAKASLAAERIKLRQIKNTAPISYEDAYKNLDATVKDGFNYADNAIRNRTDQFFKNIPEFPRFEISITSGNFVHYFDVTSDMALEINAERKNIETVLLNWQKRLPSMNSANLMDEADKAISDLKIISNFLDKIAGAVNSFTSVDYVYDTTVSNYKATVSLSRSDVTGAIASIVTAKDKVNAASAKNGVGKFESVLVQEAAVSQAIAAVSFLEAVLAKFVIKAPFDGLITVQDAKVGAAISAGETLVSISNQDQIYIEANISEIHIGKIAAGDPVSVDFDAFPGEVFPGFVSYIEPGDILLDGVVNYKIKINLSSPDPKMKNGLTANLKIQTAKKENVLVIPLYAISKENNQSFVNKVIGKKTQLIPITLGLVGNNGFVEVLSGLSVGDQIQF